MTKKTDYRPINCEFYDTLELMALYQRTCTLEIRQEDGQKTVVKGIIHTLQAANGVEYLELTDGRTFRLDEVLALNGMEPPSYC